MAKVYSSDKHWRVEKWIYKGIGADPTPRCAGPHTCAAGWPSRRSVSSSSTCSADPGILPAAGLLLGQPGAVVQHGRVVRDKHQLAVVLREQTMGHVVQTAGLAVQTRLRGVAWVAVALVRGLRPCPYR